MLKMAEAEYECMSPINEYRGKTYVRLTAAHIQYNYAECWVYKYTYYAND